jgi:prophage regulatory protein
MPIQPRIIRRKEVERITGLSRSSLYLGMSRGTFPQSVELGDRSVGWIEAEIYEWLQAKIARRENQRAKIAGPSHEHSCDKSVA